MKRSEQEYTTVNSEEHILACLSSSPSNTKIIRTAARMAKAFDSMFTALFVETPDFTVATKEDKERLEANRKLAEELGAHVETVYGEDIPYQIADFARISGVTRIVLGSSAVTHRHLFGKPTLTELLLSYAPDIGIHIIPDQYVDKSYHPKKAGNRRKRHVAGNALKSAAILFAATLLSLLFHGMGFTSANIIMVYILGVLLTSVATSHRIYSLISAILSVFIFNYLFTEPRYSLSAYETGYPITFVVMFLTAYITGTFAIRYKEQAQESAKTALRTKILFDADQMLSKAHGHDAIIHVAADQIRKLLGRSIVIFENKDGKLSDPLLFHTENGKEYQAERELNAAQWAFEHNHTAGATTQTFSDVDYYYLAIRVNDRVYGVIGIDASTGELDASEHGVLISILGEAALALENDQNAREKEAAAILAESEQLRANLLRTISHDLRTPLTTISGNASNLLTDADSFDEITKRQIYTDIYDDSMWLNNLVENLLYATRIEEGKMILHTSTELLSDIVSEAMRHISRKAASHELKLDSEDELLLVRADAKLIVQVVINIVDNALKYTPAGSTVRLSTRREGSMAEIRIADTGAGIPDREKQLIFEKFYCGDHKIADNRRSIGLGLYLCKAIIETHGGEIRVSDNTPHGAVFSFTLPIEEVSYHE